MTHFPTAHIITHHKNTERYAIAFTAETYSAARETISRWACDPNLSFDWFDYAQVALRLRQHMEGVRHDG